MDLKVDEVVGKQILCGVLLQALHDACAFKKPRAHVVLAPRKRSEIRQKKYNFHLEKEKLSFEARKFIREENKLFTIYCDLLNLDPEWVEKKLWAVIKKNDLEE